LITLYPGRRLCREVQSQFPQNQFLIRLWLSISRHHEMPTVSGRQPHIQHLDRLQLFQDRSQHQPRRMNLQTLLERHHLTVGKECDEDVRFDSVFQLMMNGAHSEIALECFEHGLDLSELNIAFPQNLRIIRRYVGS
jgi:hypothetical protein